MPLQPDRVDYSPIIDRPIIKWPNGARVALWISPNVEHYEYTPEYDGVRDPWPRTPYPDVLQYSYRDFGNRVGFWRMLEPLDKYNIKCCVSLNLAVLEHFPEIAQAMVERDWDFMSPRHIQHPLPQYLHRRAGTGVLSRHHRYTETAHRETA